MKKVTLFVTIVICYASSVFGQTAEQKRAAANALWADAAYKKNTADPLAMPAAVPLQVNDVETKTIAPTFSALDAAITQLSEGNGGMIKFNNGATPAIIKFEHYIHIQQHYPTRDKAKTIVIQGQNIIFDGQNRSSLFVVRGNLRVIFQDATFRNAHLQGVSMDNLKKIFRTGGAAIEVSQSGPTPGSLRVRNCQFINNTVAHFRGMGENQNGAAIRFNTRSTGEVFGCLFKNNRAVTGGAIGGTSVTKITIVNSVFDGNISNGYTSTSGYMTVVEGAGALRVDRTVEPIEVYGSTFVRNAANVKVSAVEIFIRPVADIPGNYPSNGPALIIDHCRFKANTHYGYVDAIDPQKVFFAGCLVFHSGGVDANFRGGKMKMTNTVFEDNEVGQANIRMINNFEISNCIFAHTKYLDESVSKVGINQRGAVFLQAVHDQGIFNQCTFYKNEPTTGSRASDIMFWLKDLPSKVSLNNSIFYRDDKNTSINQVAIPLKGDGNLQFVPDADMSSFDNVSTNASTTSDPELVASYVDQALIFEETLSAINLCTDKVSGKGGLKSCSGKEITSVSSYTKTSIKLCPNPTQDILKVVGAKVGAQVIIYNTQGLIVLQKTIDSQQLQLNVHSLKAGMYVVQVSGQMFRFIKS